MMPLFDIYNTCLNNFFFLQYSLYVGLIHKMQILFMCYYEQFHRSDLYKAGKCITSTRITVSFACEGIRI